MLRKLISMKRNGGARFMAIASGFFLSAAELAAFISPQAAMAETRRELDEYTMYVEEDTVGLNFASDFMSTTDTNLTYSTLSKNKKTELTVNVDTNHPNYRVDVPIRLSGLVKKGNTATLQSIFLDTKPGSDIPENDWSIGLTPSDVAAGYSRANYSQEFTALDNGGTFDCCFQITNMGVKKSDTSSICPVIYLSYKDDANDKWSYTYCPIQLTFKRGEKGGTVSVTVESGDGGKASADSDKAEKGDKVTIEATPNDGFKFDSYAVKSGDITIEDPSSAKTTFTVNGTGSDIKIKAIFIKDTAPRIKTKSLPKATLSENYAAKIETENINDAEFTSDDLPVWLSLGRNTGELSGTPRETGKYRFTVKVSGKGVNGDAVDLSQTYSLKVKEPSKHEDSDDDDDHHDSHEPASWEKNPNEKQALVMTASGMGTGVTVGRQEQGEIAKAIFKGATPAGWQEGFSFNMLVNGKADYSLKSGTFTLIIPSEYQKTGRQYAILAMGKNGQVFLLGDTDQNPSTITVNVNFEGYAMELIYKD